MDISTDTDLLKLPLIGAKALGSASHGVVLGMVVVEHIVGISAKLRREVLGCHGAVGRMPIAVKPRPVAGEWLALCCSLRADLLRRRRLRRRCGFLSCSR